MSKNTNLSFLTNFVTADIVNSRVGINNVSPQTTLDVTGTGKFSGVLTLGSTISNGTYAYTLPSATGTFALTSDIPSLVGYVPYTGATSNVNLGTNSISAGAVTSTGGLRVETSGGTGYALNLRQATGFSLWSGAPYTSIYANTSNQVIVRFSNDNRSITLDGSIVSASTPRTFTFPDATGTIALTSQIPTNPVGGTGSTNYLPKFTGASTIGNSSIIDNGAGRVSIGTTSFLDSFVISNGGTTGWEFNNSGSVITYNRSTSAYIPMTFEASSYILNRGNLLVNTSTDSGFKLDVNGTGRFSSHLRTDGVVQWNGTVGALSYGSGFVTMETNSDTQIRLVTNGTTALTLATNQAATFSSSVTATQVYTYSTSATTSAIFETNAANSYIGFKSTSGTCYVGNVAYAMTFEAGGSERMRITSDGNIGIGLTPNSWDNTIFRPLQIGASGSFLIGRTDGYSQTQLGTNGFYDGSNWKYVISSSSEASRYYQSGGEHVFESAAAGTSGNNITWNPRLYITSSGNVLIGTTTDSGYKFEVRTSTYKRIASYLAGDYISGFKFSDLNGGIQYDAAIDTLDLFSNFVNGKIIFSTASTERMRITSSGNVGIGTASPTEKLHIVTPAGADFQTAINLEKAGGYGNVYLQSYYENVPNYGLAVKVGNVTGMVVNGAGQVGIGTASPSQLLDIVGSNSTELGALRLYNSAGSPGSQNSVSLLMQVRNSINNLPSVKLIAQESTNDSNLGELIVQTSNDNLATLSEVVRIAQSGAGGARFIRMASGTGGIQFNGDTAAANALDDYEEGTWTPTIRGAVTAGTYELSSICSYTKIGRQVTANGFIVLASSVTGGGTTYAQITGLPFVKASNTFSSGTVAVSGIDFTGTYLTCEFVTLSSTNIIYISEVVDGGSGIDLPVSAIGANDVIKFTITYFT